MPAIKPPQTHGVKGISDLTVAIFIHCCFLATVLGGPKQARGLFGFTPSISDKDPRFKTITDFIRFSISNYAHSLGYDPNKRKILITWLWASIQFKGGFHVKHFHGGSPFSGTYYIDVPDNAGNIRFYDPKETARMAEPRPDIRNRMNVLELNVKPENGKIVIFPAYLQHDVMVHKQEKPRFSVSFNAILDEKLGS